MQSRIKHLLKHFALVLKAKLNQLKPFVRFVFHPSTLLPSPTYRIIKGLHIQTLFILLYASFSCPYNRCKKPTHANGKKIKSDRCHSSPGHSGLPAPGSSIRRYFRYLPIKSGNRVSNTNAGYSTEKQRDNLNKPDRIITQTVPKPGLSGEIAETEANRTKNPLDCILRHNKCVFQS